jgi:type I restriction enzyme S subunit
LAKVTRLPVDGVCVGEFLVLRPRPCDVAPEFLEKILRSKTIIDTINSSTFGAKMPRADWGFIGSLLLAFPPLDEQAAIVRFLDHADARIRRYIRAKQKLIKLVEAEKQAIIQRAVTRGIDSTAPLQSSGVEWLGDVPKHWEVRRIKTLFCEKDQRNGDGNGLLLSLTRARGIIPQTEASNRIASAEDLSNYKVCRTGDLVMNRMQAWSGMFAVSPQEGVVSPDYSVFGVIGSLRAEFFEYLFKTPLLVDQFAQRSKGIGSGFNRLYTRDFGSVPVAVPPLPEQSRIVEFLHDATSGLSSIVDRAHHEIALLREYNICLIADAVTGKLDVREAAKALPQEAPEAERLDEIEDVPQDESVAEDMGLEAADVP